jgi:ABC-type phosphate/phosphonate transport system substrate-binding protein
MDVRVGVNEPFCERTACVCAGADTPRAYGWLADVARGAGIEAEASYVTLEDDLASALEAGEIDGVIAKAWTALSAFRAARVDCERLCDLTLPDGTPDLTGVFITAADGPIRSMDDLTGRRLATGRQETYETSHAVDRVLQALRIVPGARREYDRCVHAAVSVLEDETDAAVVSSYCVRFGLDAYVGRPGAFRTLGETAPIPYATLAVSTAVPRDVRARLKASLLEAVRGGSVAPRFAGSLGPPVEWTPAELERV